MMGLAIKTSFFSFKPVFSKPICEGLVVRDAQKFGGCGLASAGLFHSPFQIVSNQITDYRVYVEAVSDGPASIFRFVR